MCCVRQDIELGEARYAAVRCKAGGTQRKDRYEVRSTGCKDPYETGGTGSEARTVGISGHGGKRGTESGSELSHERIKILVGPRRNATSVLGLAQLEERYAVSWNVRGDSIHRRR